MPLRNYLVIFCAMLVALPCYVTARRVRTAAAVGDAIDMIDQYYVDPVDPRELLEAAMTGLTKPLDPHSQYIPPAAYDTFQDILHQEFAGIGILVDQPDADGPVRVITPLFGSPALEAGLLPGDRIIRVDGEDVASMPLGDVSQRLRGPIGTTVRLSVRRGEPQTTVTVQVPRRQIAIDSVVGDYRNDRNQWVYRLEDKPSVAYVRISSFGEKTVDELRQVLTDLDNDFAALVLDLRGNAGGLLSAAVDTCDMLLDAGQIVSTRGRGGQQEMSWSAEAGTLVHLDKPLAVLIDGDSASASEIVAACLQDHQRAAIVGSRSYGKGTVQNVLLLEYGRSALKLTTARYYRPSGKDLHRNPEATEEDAWGVVPDPGLAVEVDAPTYGQIVSRWQRAAYPVIEGAALPWPVPARSDQAPESAEPPASEPHPSRENAPPSTTDPEAEAPADAIDVVPLRSWREDPVLRRAVEHLLGSPVKAASAPAA